MPGRGPSNSPRRVIGLFLTLVLVPSALLVGLGWRLFEQDRAAARQELQDRRRQTADLAVSMLEQALVAAEQSLRDPALLARVGAQGDAAAILIDRAGRSVAGGGRLAFLPLPAPGLDVPSKPFADADDWRRRGEVDRARARYEELSRSRDAAVRAGAWLRLGWLATPITKLSALARLASVQGIAIENVPVELFARVARCELLKGLGRGEELRREAARVRDDLVGGKWSISRRVFDANLHSVREWLGEKPSTPPTNAERLASAFETWWLSSESSAAGGRRHDSSLDATTVWISSGERRVALVALPAFIEREWLVPIAVAAAKQNARVEIRPPGSRAGSTDEERRTAADTGLPWTVVVSDADAVTDLRRLDGRRSMWLGGLGALVVLLAAGAYLVTRSIGRELAVARLQSDFVAAVSHEFRTPLTSMRQLTEVLVDERVTDSGRRRSYYLALARQTDRLHRLVESLLDLGRLESGRSPYRLEPLDACALVRSVVDDFQHERAGQGVEIDLEIDGTELPVAGDKDALTNALWNLLDNAVKYSPDCRTVWVTVHPERDRLLIRVRDEGIGIPTDEQRAVFEKFVRGARAKADGFKGTGIGLSMVQYIVAAHGGEVRVQSTPGDGSTFTLALPLAKFEVRSSKFEAAT